MSYTVGQIAGLAGVTVRTLHHYDQIGLLTAAERGESGYRRYDRADLERLHQILSYRELGLTLEAIAALLDDPASDPIEHLRRQQRLLSDRIARLAQMRAAVTTTMEAYEMGIALTPEERFELFGDFDPAVYEEETQERWGHTDAYAESRRRAGRYTKDEWRAISDEAHHVEQAFAGALGAGIAADSEPAADLAEAHREHLVRWFYDCSGQFHRCLADMFIADPRFSAHYERIAPGLARYVHDAIHTNADRLG